VGPYEEDTLVFDVETMPKFHRYAIMATAGSPSAWYCWISPWLLGETDDSAHLIPLGPGRKDRERIVVGHNVAYDRARVLEEYNLGSDSGIRWVDTLSLHVAVKGISSVQRPAWLKWKNEAAKQAKLDKESIDGETGEPSRQSPLSEARLEADHQAELAANLEGDSSDANFERWESITSVNSLLEVAKLHCGITMDKSTRNAFMTDTPSEIRAELSTYLAYCATDVHTTHAVFRKVFPLFLAACPHPASWAGVMRMGSSFLPVNQEWERYIERAEAKYREIEGTVKRKLGELAEEARTLMDSGGWRGDVFLEQMDWTPKVAGKSRGFWVPTKKELNELEQQEKRRVKQSTGTPRWFTELAADPTSHRARDIFIPLLLQVKWKNRLMFHSSEHGWIYRNPSANTVPEEDSIVTISPNDPIFNFHKAGYVFVRPADLQKNQKVPFWSGGVAGALLKAGVLSTQDDALAKSLAKEKMPTSSSKKLLALASTARSRKSIPMQQLDWSVTGTKHEEKTVVQADTDSLNGSKHPDGLVPPEGFKYPPPIWPQWYWELTKPRPDAAPGTIDLTVRNRLAPLLLRLGWLGHPLFHSREHGWCYRVKSEETSSGVSSTTSKESGATPSRTPPVAFTHPDDDHLREETARGGAQFFKLPHAQGHEANVGCPLSKSFMKYAQDGTLKSIPKSDMPTNVEEVLGVVRAKYVDSTDHARTALDMNAQCSYWMSARDRVLNQMVVWEKTRGELGMGKVGKGKVVADDEKWGVILPQVVTMGTVTRRAMEATWLTASNAKKNRIGSELKAMVRAPPGYAIVGADVDSEELWISSVMGDAQFGMHGATAIGWMTLEGTKKAGTDLHSKTASILGISRDTAKVFNYSRIYGAGMRHAVLLLMQANAGMSTAEAQKLAEKLYASTKGRNMHSTQWFGRRFWYGGTESFLFNKLEAIAHSERPMTPALGCGVTSALSKRHLSEEFGSDYLTSRINWVVQSSGVDYLHLLITAMDHLLKKYSIQARYMISVHDEVRYLVKEEAKYRVALALQIANLWTRSLFAFRLGLDDLPISVGFFSAVDIDFILRKEVDMDCVTPSQPIPQPHGQSLDIRGVLERTNNGSLWADGRPMENWRTRPKDPAPAGGYVAPDCTVHRAEGPEFLNAQSTQQMAQVRMLGRIWADKLKKMGRKDEVEGWRSIQSRHRTREMARRDAQILTESFGTQSPRFSLQEIENILVGE
jgi:DNA polymerase gamma 1